MTSVLVVDDHPIVLQGCRQVLSDLGMETILEARDVAAAYRTYRQHRPDIAVVDLGMENGGLGGLDLIRRLKSFDADTRILVFSMHRDPVIVTRALDAGALGYLLKDTPPEEMVEAVKAVRAGRPYMSHALAVEVAMLGRRGGRAPLDELTPRELQVFALLAEGKSYGAIAASLHVSYKTVVNASYQLKQKLGAANLPELIRLAVQHLGARAPSA
ncbi:response regulator transcription factor [Marinivivus vitaminiproducens]|uniref:response regulator transcription factor n=1 Tax=Marinivivus vitaminiproducens TaxID=3035935 RepID=UPI0027995942|nr:response regulator transcription factor [Geminicoccaceae bacterium SCSIO 64248]